jgi:hypothetical protein
MAQSVGIRYMGAAGGGRGSKVALDARADGGSKGCAC